MEKGTRIMSQVTQPAELLATMFVPDRKLGPDTGRKYGLVQVGECFYMLVFRNPQLDWGEQHMSLDGAPVDFILQRDFSPNSPGEANEHGHLFFRAESDARAWFEDTSEEWFGEISLEERGSMLSDKWLNHHIGAIYASWLDLVPLADLPAKVLEGTLETIRSFREVEQPEQYQHLIEKRVQFLMQEDGL
jgi:hypothetical protein